MKRLSISILAIIAIALTACDKESSGTEFEFSNMLPPYVTVTDGDPEPDTLKVVPGEESAIVFSVRMGLSKSVKVTYNIAGFIQQSNQTVDIDKYTLTAEVPFTVADNQAIGSLAEVTTVSAARSDGVALTVGRYNDPKYEKLVIQVVEPE
jgi:hypothetical protein